MPPRVTRAFEQPGALRETQFSPTPTVGGDVTIVCDAAPMQFIGQDVIAQVDVGGDNASAGVSGGNGTPNWDATLTGAPLQFLGDVVIASPAIPADAATIQVIGGDLIVAAAVGGDGAASGTGGTGDPADSVPLDSAVINVVGGDQSPAPAVAVDPAVIQFIGGDLSLSAEVAAVAGAQIQFLGGDAIAQVDVGGDGAASGTGGEGNPDDSVPLDPAVMHFNGGDVTVIIGSDLTIQVDAAAMQMVGGDVIAQADIGGDAAGSSSSAGNGDPNVDATLDAAVIQFVGGDATPVFVGDQTVAVDPAVIQWNGGDVTGGVSDVGPFDPWHVPDFVPPDWLEADDEEAFVLALAALI